MYNDDVIRVMEMMPQLRDFIVTVSDIISVPKEYADYKISTVELQILRIVEESPGLKITDIAQSRERTLSSASRKVDRLVEKGLLQKRKLPGNKKNICLYLTSQGQEVVRNYYKCDREKLAAEAEKLLEKHTIEQIEEFFEIIGTMQKIVEDEFYV